MGQKHDRVLHGNDIEDGAMSTAWNHEIGSVTKHALGCVCSDAIFNSNVPLAFGVMSFLSDHGPTVLDGSMPDAMSLGLRPTRALKSPSSHVL